MQVDDEAAPEYHQLFEYVFVVGLKEDSKGKLTTEMTYTFPPVSSSAEYSSILVLDILVF